MMQAQPTPDPGPEASRSPTPPGHYEQDQVDFDTFFTSAMHGTEERSSLNEQLTELGIPIDDDDDDGELFARRKTTKPTQSIEDDSDTLNVDSEASSKKSNGGYDDMLNEAEEIFGDKKPTFCIMNKNKLDTKIVRDIGADEDVEMTFRTWQNKEYGY